MSTAAHAAASSRRRPLESRVALVTGADGGLGRAICERLADAGADVVGVDLAGDDCLHADVATVDGNRRMVEHAVERHGRLDILVLNAGAQHMAPLQEFPVEQWDRLIALMLTGPFLALRAAWPELTRRPGGRVVVTASTSSFVAERFKAAYVAAKHGVLGLVKVAAREGAPFGLAVNAVAPSWVATPLVENQLPDRARLLGLTEEQALAAIEADQPGGRLIEPREVASAVAFLADPATTGINGACVPVDLGALS